MTVTLRIIDDEAPEPRDNAGGSLYEGKQVYAAMPIETLRLENRTRNVLRREGIDTIGQLMNYTLGDLLNLRNFGVASAGDVISKITEMDLEQRVQLLEQQVAELLGGNDDPGEYHPHRR